VGTTRRAFPPARSFASFVDHVECRVCSTDLVGPETCRPQSPHRHTSPTQTSLRSRKEELWRSDIHGDNPQRRTPPPRLNPHDPGATMDRRWVRAPDPRVPPHRGLPPTRDLLPDPDRAREHPVAQRLLEDLSVITVQRRTVFQRTHGRRGQDRIRPRRTRGRPPGRRSRPGDPGYNNKTTIPSVGIVVRTRA